MKPILRKIYNEIKKHDHIVIARHIGPDPDAVASQMALRDSIMLTFPKKKVYAVGTGVSKFKVYGLLNKLDENTLVNPLLIILDTPNLSRVDGVDVNRYKNIIKIDHHPFEHEMGKVEYIDETASSTAQMVIELILNTKLKINDSIAKNLFLGVISDSDRFLLSYTNIKTFELVTDLLKETKIDFVSLYPIIYERPLVEIKFFGWLCDNLAVTENGFGYLNIDNEIIKKFNVDTATASNMVNDFNFVKEVVVWMFVTYDEKNDLYKINIRSRGPIINTVAAKFNGGGHKFASGIRTTDLREIENIKKDLDEVCRLYKEEQNNEDKPS